MGALASPPTSAVAAPRPQLRVQPAPQQLAVRHGPKPLPQRSVNGGAAAAPLGSTAQQPLRPRQPIEEPGNVEDLLEDLDVVDYTPPDHRRIVSAPASVPAEASSISPSEAARRTTRQAPGGDTADADSNGGGWPEGGSNSSSNGSGGGGDADGGAAASQATEFILRLERRGEGWAEEILPHFVVEKRLLEKPRRDRPRSSQPDPWEEGSLEEFLQGLRLDREQVDATVQTATRWRVTDAGRPLLDRRRRSRVQRNVASITEHLVCNCGLSLEEAGQLLMTLPLVLLCKPTHNDRFDRRVVSLAAFRFRHGHVDVPDVRLGIMPHSSWEGAAELVPWMKRMRVSRAQGSMSEERQQILESLGFEFGEVAQITDDWEMHFDQLVDWLVWADENNIVFPGWLHGRTDDPRQTSAHLAAPDSQEADSIHCSAEVPLLLFGRRCGIDWGQGGPTAREVALWVQLQRELRRRGLLQAIAEQRLNAIGIAWQPQDGRDEDRRWMSRLGRLLFVMERARRKRANDVASLAAATAEFERAPLRFSDLLVGRPPPAPLQQDDLFTRRRTSSSSDEPRRKPGRPPLGRSGGVSALKHEEVIAERRAAMRLATLESGLGFWLTKQRWLWRRNRLPQERFEMLRLAGVDMDCSAPSDWLVSAHSAARLVTGGSCAGATPQPWPEPEPRQQLPDLYGYGPPQPVRRAAKAAAAGAAPSAAATPAQRVHRSATAQQATPGMLRPNIMAVRRWVLTQKKLKETQDREREVNGRDSVSRELLSTGQFRYLQLLGITWLLSNEVVAMRPAKWFVQYEQLAQTTRRLPAAGATTPRAVLRTWLAHQKGLHALGLLPRKQKELLDLLGVRWQQPLTASETRWATCFAHLVAYLRRHGHCQVPKDIGALAEWQAHQMALWRSGKLPATRQLQLRALAAADTSQAAAPSGRKQ